jgi:hypothetical protein
VIGPFYRRLWREAEKDRREAEASTRRMARAVLGVLDALEADDHPNPEIRGEIRKLRIEVERR